MRINKNLVGKEVLDAEIQIIGKVFDVIIDDDTFEITDLVVKKGGLAEQIKSSENIVPIDFIKTIGDKVLLKSNNDIIWFSCFLKNI